MKDKQFDVNRRIASRVRDLRQAQHLSMEALAERSGVSRSMISVIERGESSPTAVVLDKLAVGLGVTLGSLFDTADGAKEEANCAVSRRKDQTEWKDPGSGYVRRNVSPTGKAQMIQIVDARFPPGARVAFETATRRRRAQQQIWLLEGSMEITVGKERHLLNEDDCLAMELNEPISFYNSTRKWARYAVIIAEEHPNKSGR